MRISSTFILALAVFFSAGFFLVSGLHAQTVVGTSIVNGKEVTLFSDGTWSYSEPSSGESCINVAKDLSFCGGRETWLRMPSPGPGIAAQFRHTSGDYVQLVVENFGSRKGLTFELAQRAAVALAATATGVSEADIPILTLEDAQVRGKPAKTLVYSAKANGLLIVFANTIVIEPERLVQVQSYSIGAKTYSDTHRSLHATLLDLIRLGE